MRKPVYFEEYLDTGAPQYLLHFPAGGSKRHPRTQTAPVVLFVHGGPGFSESFVGHQLKKMLGDSATLVFWDQRGAGKTLAASGWPISHTVTVEEVKRDMQAVVDHLKRSYDRPKIALAGHSWGTVLGSLYALEHPDDLLLYIGIGQVVEMRESSRRTWEELAARIVAAGNRKDLAALPAWEDLRYPLPLGKLPPNEAAFMRLRRKYHMLVTLGPRELLTMICHPTFAFSDFSFLRKRTQSLRKDLLDFLTAFDLCREGYDYKTPVAYILGEDDTVTCTSLAVEYFERLRAPAKLLSVIPNAGHNPMGDALKAFAAAFRAALELIDQT
ncbi:MAG: alpha/beta hydrolase [Bifidobacteriaceae bacterium]|jgi:pimeloyl-ACP methyl ester carboxylesterase|nr:alpha/beta hydrolase [Bifidobacteriaceae bacterium]